MAYSERADTGVRPVQTTTTPIVDYHDTVRWGPIFAGIVVAIISQLMLSALVASIGGFAAGEARPSTIGTGIGIGAIISLLISLFLGGLTMASSCGPMNSKTSMLNATVMWATTLVLSGFLLTSGVSGAFGIIASNAGAAVTQVEQSTGVSVPDSKAEVDQAVPNITSQQAEDAASAAAKGGLAFLIGSLLALVAALVGATVGAKKPRAVVR